MKIVITGGAGFIGANIALNIKQKYPAYTIVVLDNLIRRGSEVNIEDLLQNKIEFIEGDIRNMQDLDTLGGFDCMIEASAEPSVLSGIDESPTYIINNNLIGAVNCFNTCLAQKAQLIFLSTSRVYPIKLIEQARFTEEATRFTLTNDQSEQGISAKGINEALSLDFARSFYGTTKLAAELLIKEYQEFYGLKAAVTRFGVVAGPRQMGKSDQGIAALWMAKHYWKKPLKYIGYGGEGKQVRDLLHIDDLTALIDHQIHHIELFDRHVFNAGGGLSNSISLTGMTLLCEEITGNKIEIEPVTTNRPADIRVYISDNSKIEQMTGWTPRKNLHDIFNDLYYWIKTNEVKLNPFLNY